MLPPSLTAAQILSELGLPPTDLHELPSSPFTFPDGRAVPDRDP